MCGKIREISESLEELRIILHRIKSTPSLIEEMEGIAADHFYRGSLEADAYDASFEDAIKVREWAMKLGRRARLEGIIESRVMSKRNLSES